MKVKLRIQETLTLDFDSVHFTVENNTPERIAARVREAAMDDPYFLHSDDRTVFDVKILEVDGVREPQGDWLPEVEEVAGIIHAAWMDEKLVAGIKSRRAEDGEELMVPYSQLSEKAKASNRILVRTVYAAIADAKDA